MNKNKETGEQKIIELINKDKLTKDESLVLIEELYWADWDILKENYPNNIDKVFVYLKKDDFSNEEISGIFKLYNNPHGVYIEEFSDIVINLYNGNKTRFIKSLNIDKDEYVNLVYLFRNHLIELDEDVELKRIIESSELSEEEKETAEALLKAYKHACST